MEMLNWGFEEAWTFAQVVLGMVVFAMGLQKESPTVQVSGITLIYVACRNYVRNLQGDGSSPFANNTRHAVVAATAILIAYCFVLLTIVVESAHDLLRVRDDNRSGEHLLLCLLAAQVALQFRTNVLRRLVLVPLQSVAGWWSRAKTVAFQPTSGNFFTSSNISSCVQSSMLSSGAKSSATSLWRRARTCLFGVEEGDALCVPLLAMASTAAVELHPDWTHLNVMVAMVSVVMVLSQCTTPLLCYAFALGGGNLISSMGVGSSMHHDSARVSKELLLVGGVLQVVRLRTWMSGAVWSTESCVGEGSFFAPRITVSVVLRAASSSSAAAVVLEARAAIKRHIGGSLQASFVEVLLDELDARRHCTARELSQRGPALSGPPHGCHGAQHTHHHSTHCSHHCGAEAVIPPFSHNSSFMPSLLPPPRVGEHAF